VRTARVNAILGTHLSPEDVRGYLDPIGFQAAEADGRDPSIGDFDVTIPTWRPDSEREIDVVEEVARHHGYSRIRRTRPAVTSVGGLTPYQRDRRLAADILVGVGLSEAWATSFLAPTDLARAGLPVHAVEVENPLTAEESMLRTSLLPGLLRALVTNASHRRPDVGLFEVGHVFLPPPGLTGLPQEPEHLAVVLGGRDAAAAVRLWRALVDGLRLADVRLEGAGLPGLHPTRSARIVVGGEAVGAIGEIDPDVLGEHGLTAPVGWIEVVLDRLLAGPRRPATYKPVSRFPSADIDLAVIVDDAVPAADVEAALREAGGDELESVELFDVYRGDPAATGSQPSPGRRSLAYHLRFSSLDHTLTDEELAGLRRRCIEAVETAVGATLRG
jgi:phenylalanyl-tRNA synthetase beta chain